MPYYNVLRDSFSINIVAMVSSA